MTESLPHCPNCASPVQGRYCSECGQDNRRPRLEMRAVLLESAQNVVGWDSALGRTLAGLLRRPGGVPSDYVEGRRRRYVNPARFCLLALALWLLVGRALGIDVLEVTGIRVTGGRGDEFLADSERDLTATRIRGFLSRNLDLLLYLSLPLRALFLSLLFRRSGRNLAENMVLVLYLSGLGYLFQLSLTPALLWEPRVRLVAQAMTLIWFLRAVHEFHGRGWVESLWRSAVVVIAHLVGTILLFAAIAIPWLLWIAE